MMIEKSLCKNLFNRMTVNVLNNSFFIFLSFIFNFIYCCVVMKTLNHLSTTFCMFVGPSLRKLAHAIYRDFLSFKN